MPIALVLCYKVDRLSRSLLDFAKLMETFEKHKVSFVAVTQQFNSSTSMGRLVLNVLLSFAQFEREIISERTRDKISAARRKGKWAGGMPLLGYDVVGSKLIVNADEAVRIREIFSLYLQHEALLPVVKELDRRGWVNKRWTTHKGRDRGGKPFTKTNLHKLLTNVTYLGKVRHKKEIFDGAHDGIIDSTTWQKVQVTMSRNGRTGGALVRNKFGAILKGLVRCTACSCLMSPSHSTRGSRRYRYYVCTQAQKRGWQACPTKSVPAGEIEGFVIDRIRSIGKDQSLWHDTIAQARSQGEQRAAELMTEQRSLERDLKRWNGEVRELARHPLKETSATISTLADLHDRVRVAEVRLNEVRSEIESLQSNLIGEGEVADALAQFDPVWSVLTPHEQTRLIHLLVAGVDVDGQRGKVTMHFHPSGIRTLASELNHRHGELK